MNKMKEHVKQVKFSPILIIGDSPSSQIHHQTRYIVIKPLLKYLEAPYFGPVIRICPHSQEFILKDLFIILLDHFFLLYKIIFNEVGIKGFHLSRKGMLRISAIHPIIKWIFGYNRRRPSVNTIHRFEN